jgi:hypothetical protein
MGFILGFFAAALLAGTGIYNPKLMHNGQCMAKPGSISRFIIAFRKQRRSPCQVTARRPEVSTAGIYRTDRDNNRTDRRPALRRQAARILAPRILAPRILAQRPPVRLALR